MLKSPVSCISHLSPHREQR